jgi:DNA-binding transcriptional LysR family regulator
VNSNASVLRNRLVSRARIRHLQVFVRVAELGTVKRAAEAVGLTQPAATQAVADLEALLECRLFLRHSRGMLPTPVGHALLPLARRILLAIDDGAGQVAAMAGEATGVVRVAAITGALAGLLVRAIPAFSARHPDVVVHLHEADALQQAALVERGDVDLSLCRAPDVTPQGWRFVALMDDRFAVVAGPGHPLLRRRRVGVAQLGRATWLNTPAGTAAREAFDRLFADAPAPPRTSPVITRSPAMLWAMLSQQPLLALLPLTFARQLIDAKLLFEVSLDTALPFEPLGMLLPTAEPGPATRTLAGFLEAFVQARV